MEKYKKFLLSMIPYIIILIMSICGTYIVFYEGIPMGHDYKFHVSNMIEQYETIVSGHKLSPISGIVSMGLGTGTRLFYAPLPHLTVTILALFLRLFDGSLLDAYKCVIVLSVFISGIFSYRFAMHFTKGNKIASIIGAGVFVLYPYRIFDAFCRFAYAEFYSIMFLPLFFMGLYDITHFKDKVKVMPFVEVILGGSLLFLSHNITAFYTYVFAFIYLLFNLKGLIHSFKLKGFLSYAVNSVFLLIGIASIALFSQLELMGTRQYLVSDDLLMWTNYEEVITRTDEQYVYSGFLSVKSLAYFYRDYFTKESIITGILLYIFGCMGCIASDLLTNKFLKLKKYFSLSIGALVLFAIISIASRRIEIYLSAVVFFLIYLFIRLFSKKEYEGSKDKIYKEPLLYYSILMAIVCFVLMKYEWPWQYLPSMFLKIQFPWRLWALIQLFAMILVAILVHYLNFKRIASFTFTICVGLLLVSNSELIAKRIDYESGNKNEWVAEIDYSLLDSGIANGFNKEYMPIVYFQSDYYDAYKNSDGVYIYQHLPSYESRYSKSLYGILAKRMLFNFTFKEDYYYKPVVLKGTAKVEVIEAFSPEYTMEINVNHKDGAIIQMPLVYYPGYDIIVVNTETNEEVVMSGNNIDGFVSFSLNTGNYVVETKFTGTTFRKISVAYTIISVSATLGLIAYALFFENKRRKDDEDKTC